MKENQQSLRPIWLDKSNGEVNVIDQRSLPHELVVLELQTVDDTIYAIQEMVVRGAPLIGITAAYGVYLAVKNTPAKAAEDHLATECERIKAARPTAVNLQWAVDRVLAEILTHCNAGWLATIAYGTATAPIYTAYDQGVDVHVWVDETRPLNQGARLTAWELGRHGISHAVITDNAGGHLMQHGLVDMVIVGTDRSTYTGDVANKIGTYLKALAAKDNDVPFYVALPSSTFDWTMRDGVGEIPIEERDPDEIRYIQGYSENSLRTVLIPPASSPAANYAFDVTPARLVTGFITERGICAATEDAVRALFPDKEA